MTDGDTHAVRVSALMGFAVLADDEADADWEYCHILGIADLLHDLVEGQLAERVNSRRDEDDVFLSLHPIQAVKGVIKRVKQVGFRESWDPQLVQGTVNRVLVLREVHQDVRLHVVVRHRNPVVLLQAVGESVGSLQRLHHEDVVG